MFGSPSLARLAPLLLLIVVGLLLPGQIPQYYLYLGNVIMMYAVLAIGLDLLLGWAGQFAFAHIAFFGVGVYGTALFQLRLDLPYVVALPAAAAVAGIIGFLIAIPATRLRAVYLALATFAFAEGAQWVFNAWDSVTGGADGLRLPKPSLFGYALGSDPAAFPVMAGMLVLVLMATMFLTTSRFGRAMCAVRESEHAAAASGIDVRGTKVLAFAISGVYAGIAGGMFAMYQSFANPEVFGFGQVVLVLSMIVVGGLGTIPGVLIGVVILGLLPEVLRTTMRNLLVWQELVYGVILILAMMFMPRGLWGFVRGKRRKAGA
ncbi:MAG: branched-chain amino acid ABC transporter permease [Rhodospirillaceae bacterium]|nr:branched-chain amino acid ABC transporter permease [Rhodospirillaceae bacterium]